ncbi:helix-turn-helix domain-containing protein [Streptacidiphilus sp. EB103A]|uniref:helix-turn-helix domain-containing protein n=1 Tax=Streptacidiphilus sp. EB103A TaxID=3156275 RepID=UPI003512FC2E
MGTLEKLRVTVAALRQAAGQSQADLAAGVGLTQEKVSRRQSGVTAWTLDEVDLLAGHFRIPVLTLLAGPTVACEALESPVGPVAAGQDR